MNYVDEAECSRCGETYPATSEATLEHHYLCTGEAASEEILTRREALAWVKRFFSSLG